MRGPCLLLSDPCMTISFLRQRPGIILRRPQGNKPMKPHDVLQHPANVLTDAQRRAFFDKGYVALPDYVPERWLVRLRAAMAELLDRSRSKTETDSIYV